MDALMLHRRTYKGQITRLQKVVTDHQNQPFTDVELAMYLQKVDKLTDKVDEMQISITALCTDEEFVNHEQEYNDMVSKLEILQLAFMQQQHVPITQQEHSTRPSSNIKLPKIELPVFGGQYEDWLSFHDLFAATVHNNALLSGAQKLQYLKSSLKNEASLLVQSIPITDGNYIEAWEILTNRFNNPREIVSAHVKRLFNQPNSMQESSKELRRLIDTTTECIRALKVLEEPVQHWDAILIHILKEKMDQESRRQWELSLTNSQRPTFQEIASFLEQRARALAASETNNNQETVLAKSQTSGKDRRTATAVHHGSTRSACVICNGLHYPFNCPIFLKASVNQRQGLVKKHALCNNCLRGDHKTFQCKAGHCKKCTFKHNTLLHNEEESQKQHTPKLQSKFQEADVVTHISRDKHELKQVLLSTAILQVKDSMGQLQSCRALLDSASQASFITEACTQRLQLKRRRINNSISGIASIGIGTSRGTVNLELSTLTDSTVSINVEAIILQNVTKLLPNFPCDPSSWSHIKGLQLADPTFHNPGQIDILLGADIYADLLQDGIIKGPTGKPSAYNTIFGWILSGPIDGQSIEKPIFVHHTQCDIDNTMKLFWEIEEVPRHETRMTADEKKCEQFFNETHSRDSSGRYVVRLPFQESSHNFGNSRNMAIRRFKQVERRLISNPETYAQYRDFMQEYIQLEHMQLIPPSEINQENGVFYLPHHAVFKDSSTTKLRVVFDASAKSSSGVSLNDELLVGPKLQEDLINHLLRFRVPAIAMTADITKMYRQVRVHHEDVDFQRIVWRNNPDEPLQDYRLLTVTYGTASAPYLATKVLQKLAKDEETNFPLAAPVLLQDFYIDDLMTGVDTRDEALNLQSELIELARSGGFELRKWTSNDPELLKSVPPNMREIQLPLELGTNGSVKTLGLHWHPGSDEFSFTVTSPSQRATITKRTMLSDTAKLFDPLGLLSPTSVKAKLMLQELWKCELDWDDELPTELCARWQAFRKDLETVQCIKIKRCIAQENATRRRLYGFCDASERAYAAAVYMWTSTEKGEIQVQLIAAKTRVAPLKQISLPRLELCGAVLLARLIDLIQNALKTDIDEVHAWSDSTIVLGWLSSHPQKWKTFVANRVAEIQESIPSSQWHHVQSQDNPADCASRGISAVELCHHSLWWKGPSWLQNFEVPKQTPHMPKPKDCEKEERKPIITVTHGHVNQTLLYAYSSLTKLKRVTAYMKRFINNCRFEKELRQSGPLSKEELDSAFMFWIKASQEHEFHQEILEIGNNKPVSTKSKLLQLNPFLDSKGLLRVGGRLRHSRLPLDQVHPILIPHKSKLTDLIINYEHVRNLHAGSQLMMATLQQRFWIIGARDLIRFHIKRCIQCSRQRAATAQQQMGDLPAARVNPARPFLKVGIDYAGPFLLRVIKGRGHKMYKAYIALFVCFVTRAIHIELVSDLSTNAFLAALKRFVARRGKCSDIYSDCGTNFVGANRDLKQFIKLISNSKHNEQLTRWISEEEITWHFNPPSSPHFGGLWEAGIKSVKYHLKRVIGQANLTFEEMQTLLCQIEACLNSRPLTALSSDPNDFKALTPGHFLIGDALNAIPEPDLTSSKMNRLSRWQLGQQILQHFWKRWRNEYLTRLQQRPKWLTKQSNFKIGDLVLLKEEDLPPTKWKLGRILQLHPGADNFVRVVTVKTKDAVLKRPIVKLCLLPLD